MSEQRQRKLAMFGCLGIILAPFLVIYGMDFLFGLANWLDGRR